MCVQGARLIPETLEPCLGRQNKTINPLLGVVPELALCLKRNPAIDPSSHRARKMKGLDPQHSDVLDQVWAAPSRCAEPCPAVPHLWKPWSCDLQCSRPLLSSLLLWRKLLQLFAEHNVPLISCQLCRAEQFPTAGSPPSSPPPPFAKRETRLFQHLEVWSAAWGAWGSHAPLLHGSGSSHAGSLSQWSPAWLAVLAASGPRQQGNKKTESHSLPTASFIFCWSLHEPEWREVKVSCLAASCLAANPRKRQSWLFLGLLAKETILLSLTRSETLCLVLR